MTQPKDKTLSHETPSRPCQGIGADIFTINSKHYVCIVDYYRKFSKIKQVKGLSADMLIKNERLSLHNTDFPVH